VSPQIVRQEALISDARKPQLRKLIYKLIEKQVGGIDQSSCDSNCLLVAGAGGVWLPKRFGFWHLSAARLAR
jgi:hypothetical protein